MENAHVTLPEISAPRQIRALASPARQDIVDALEAAGPCSVRELADLIGRPADALYYHLKVLRRVGLLSQVASAGSADPGAVVDVTLRPLSLRYELASRTNRDGVCRVVGGMVRCAERDFRRAFKPGHAEVSGPGRDLWAGRCQAWLTDEENQQVNRLLSRILSIMRARQKPTHRASKRRGITFVSSPLPDRRRMKVL
jgi:DNA-binding transcriptional ArsR family regulator